MRLNLIDVHSQQTQVIGFLYLRILMLTTRHKLQTKYKVAVDASVIPVYHIRCRCLTLM